MNVDAIRLLIICLSIFCCLSLICSTAISYLVTGGRVASMFTTAVKEEVLVALGILGGLVTGHGIGIVERRVLEKKLEKK
jgi:mannose/fructose/N-acetylgalactosamine-specific phosphotransferase system component IIC